MRQLPIRTHPGRTILTLIVAHGLAALTAGIVLAVSALIATLVSTAQDCAGDCGEAVWDAAPQAAAGAILMAILGTLVAAIAMLPATLMLSPMALWLDRRQVAWTSMLAAGGLIGLLVGLPMTILTLGLLDWRQLTLSWFAQTYAAALPDYGLASVLGGAVFAAALVLARRTPGLAEQSRPS